MGRITWYGHACTLVELDGVNVLIDPWITNPSSPYRSVNEFIKSVTDVDFMVVTHDHGDHVGDVLELLKHYKNAKLLSIFEIANQLGNEAGVLERVIGANIGGPIKLGKLTAILTPAIHSSIRGNPTGVVLIGPEGSVYHAGDTGLFAEMSLIGELYNVKVALLPIGGHYTMGVKEAAKAVELIKPKYVIPIHYNTFDLIRTDPSELKSKVAELSIQTSVIILKPGSHFEF
ncbi:MAG: metal-dependent hydrolase [Sulfolobales archaeon]|nr:metal-dependent hydrolase [Sulfolobales archaeon]MCX8186141.1 metal-dependent hydrolase [Sulfolobales archaeon]MDW7969436.1 metal-dependent hydrolase [Sulfolobales archaeon]